MGDRLAVDAAALRRILEAATATHPDRAALAAAVADLVTSGTAAPARPWLSVDEAARLLGVSEKTVRRQVARGHLAHRRVGRRLLIAATALAPNVGSDRVRKPGRAERAS
jgi:excisionase family DNA binding protein